MFNSHNLAPLVDSPPLVDFVGLAFVLCDQDPLCIVEQQNFDQLVGLLRCWELIEGSKRRQLVDSLCSSLTCLNAWIDKLLSQPPDSVDKDSVVTHRSSFKAYIFFLQWLSSISSREAREGQMASSMSAATSTSSGRGSGRKKKSASEAAGWDWSSQLPKVMKSVSQAMSADLWALFRPARPDDAILARVTQLAAAAFAEPGSAKDPELAASASTVLAVCALRYGQMESVTSTMVELINVYEHTPPLVAELLRHSVTTFNDGRLVGAVVAELSAVDPAEYERQQNATGEKAGVRSVANFIEELAARCPKLLAGQMALLLPHLGGRAWSLRSGIIAAIGHLIAKAFIDVSNESGDQQRLAALRAKQHLLDVLVERTRDQSSFTRKAVLATWAALSEQRAVPLGHWSTVTEIAIGRLEDKSSLVRKEALRLLQALMLHNPFGPSLPVDRFAATLGTHKDMMDQLFPPEEDGMQQVVNVEEEKKKEKEKEEGAAVEEDDEDAMEVDGQDTDTEDEEEKEEEKEEGKEGNVPQQQEEGEEAPSSAPQPKCNPADVGWDGSVEELQALVASLELAVDFARSLTNSMPTTTQLLASSTVSDVQESIAFLLTCKQFEVDGAPEAIRCMLPLIFSRDQAIKDKIVEALDQLYMSGWAGALLTSAQAARALVSLASGASLGELGALEECVKEFITRGKMTPVHVHELWELATRAHAALMSGVAGAQRAQRDLRAALAVLSMAAAARPELFNSQHISAFLQYGFDFKIVADALTTRHACTALTCLEDSFKSGLYDSSLEAVYSALVATVVSSPLTDSSWFSAAESAITALYCLHPAPEHLVSSILKHMARQAFSQSQSGGGATDDAPTTEMMMEAIEDAMMNEDDGGGNDSDDQPSPSAGVRKTAVYLNVCGSQDVQSSSLSRFMFVLGHSGLQHLVYVEKVCKAVRKARNDAEKRMAEDKADRATAAAQKKSKNEEDGSSEEEENSENEEEEEEDINAELGVGSVAADAELDASKEAAEKQLLRSASSVLAPYARLISALCHSSILLSCDTTLRSSILLALTKLMIVDIDFCEANLQLLFTLLQNRSVEPALRSNLIIALGDLALRFPNALEPWTEHVYRPLGDPDSSVRKNALMVLTHLILNDMMKVKGHIAKVAVCLEDEDSRVSALARLFFHELAKKEYKGTSPIYNLLPDILSNLSREPRLNRAGFQSVMQQLLAYIKKDKQGDALTDKLCQRFAATDDPGQWRNIAFCLTQLPISDKGLKRLADGFKLYKHSLQDAEVAAAFAGIVTKAKKGEKKPEVKAIIDDLEAKVAEYVAELAADDEEEGGEKEGAATADQTTESAAQQQEEADQSDSLVAGMSDIKIQGEQSETNRGKMARKKQAAADESDDDASDSENDRESNDDDENVSMQQSHAPSGGRAKRGQVSRQSAADSEDDSMVMDDDEVSIAHNNNNSRSKQIVESVDDEEEEENGVEMEEEQREEGEEKPEASRGGRRKALAAASGSTRPGRATRKAAVVEDEDSEEEGEEYIAAIKAEHV